MSNAPNTYNLEGESEFRSAELHRLRMESAKLVAERAKAEIEAEEIRRKLNRPWYLNVLAKALVAGLVAVPLVWFYVTEVAVPLFNSKNIELKLKNEQTRNQLQKREKRLQIQIKELEGSKLLLEKKAKDLQVTIESQKTDHLVRLEKLREENLKLKASSERALALVADLMASAKSNSSTRFSYETEMAKLKDELTTYENTNSELQAKILMLAKSSEELPGFSSAKDLSLLRTNGVYQRETKEGYWGYLRFYEDGSVISISSTGSPEKIIKWFNKKHENISKGKWARNGNKIDFETTSNRGTVEYSGFIRDDVLVLNSYSHINKSRMDGALYQFVKLDI